MARTNLPIMLMTPNSAVLNNAGTTIDPVNGMNIQLPTSGIPAAPQSDGVILYVQNTAAATKTVTVRAGTNTTNDPNSPAFRGGIGDLTTGNLAASTGTAFIGPFDPSRFQQSDGSLNVDFSSGTAGTIWAVVLPKRF